MRRIALRTARICLAWIVIALLSVDTGLAFGALARMRAPRHGHTADSKAVAGAEQKARDESAIQKGACGESASQKGVNEDKSAEVEKPAAEEAKPVGPAKPAEADKPAVEKPAEVAKPAEQAKPVEVEKPAVEKPVEVEKPAEPVKPAVEKPAEMEKPAAPAQPAIEKPAAEVAPPKAEPAPAAKPSEPSQAIDDLFGATASAAKEPAAKESAPKPAAPELTPPAPAAEAKPAPKAKDALDELFDTPQQPGKPAAAPVPAPAPAPAAEKPSSARSNSDSLNGLFGDAPKDHAKPAKPVGKPASAAPASPAAKSDPFSFAPAAGTVELAGRTWTDNTGKFTVKARLVQVLDGKVRLLKENGHTCTVAMSRLSASDVTYVQSAAETSHGDAPRQFAQTGM